VLGYYHRTCWFCVGRLARVLTMALLQAVNQQACGIQGSYATTGDKFLTFSSLAGVFSVIIIVLLTLDLVFSVVAIFKPDEEWLMVRIALVLEVLAAFVGTALFVVVNNAVNAAEYADNNNVGQTVELQGGYIVIVLLPLVALIITNTVTVWTGTPE
jgi:hypothetical protein